MIRDPKRPLQGAGLTRRDLLARVVTIGTAFAIGGNFIAAPDAVRHKEKGCGGKTAPGTACEMRNLRPSRASPQGRHGSALRDGL